MASATGRQTKAVMGFVFVLLLLASSFAETADAVSRRDIRRALKKIRRSPRLRAFNFKSFLEKFVLLAINQDGPITLFLPTDPYTMYMAYSNGYTLTDFTTLGQNNMLPEYHLYKDFANAAAGTSYTTVLGEAVKKWNGKATQLVAFKAAKGLPSLVIWPNMFKGDTLVIHLTALALIPSSM
ncbi:hypothetical protein CLOM_g20022 [Closterium sp. NIES-68]|nr:hypothetical protein CLOM_g20022 [Closterium sp. NIES-68]GJP58314.1 hypothetical protein CLOP_g23191 [Closterium sp. NIES-67]